MLPNAAYSFTDIYQHPSIERTKEQQELEDIQSFFYEAPLNTREVIINREVKDPEQSELSNGMPFIKQMRIKINNHFKIKAHEEMLQQKKLEEQELKKLLEDDDETTLEDLQQENLQNLIDITNSNSKEKKEKKEPEYL